MNRRAPTLYLLSAAALLAATAPAAKSSRTAPAPEPRVSIGQHIDALLRTRLRPHPLPLDPPNPFALPGAARRDNNPSAQSTTEPPALASDGNRPNAARAATSAEILADCASRLRIGGLLRFNDQVQ